MNSNLYLLTISLHFLEDNKNVVVGRTFVMYAQIIFMHHLEIYNFGF